MYSFDFNRLRSLRLIRMRGIGRNVVLLGLVSMFTDVSAEMAWSVVPVYLVYVLHLSPLQFGFVEGLSQAASACARLVGGLTADYLRRPRDIAAAGYGLSALCKLGFLAAGSSWVALSAVVVLDRSGKGLRTAPRDALIALSSSPSVRGTAFGIHRAFDTVGALVGPLAAFGILALIPLGYDVVFVCSFFVALLGVGIMLFFISNPRDAVHEDHAVSWSVTTALSLLRRADFRVLVIVASALGVVTVGDSFIYLALQRQSAIELTAFPLLYTATACLYLVLAMPMGSFADRIGRGRVFLIGHLLLILAYVVVLAPGAPALKVALSLGLLGAYYACTDGVLMACASTILPEHGRTSGLALLATAVACSRLVASVAFAAIWNAWSITAALGIFSVALCGGIVLAFGTLWNGVGPFNERSAAQQPG